MLEDFEEIKFIGRRKETAPIMSITKTYFYFNASCLEILKKAPIVKTYLSKDRKYFAVIPDTEGLRFFKNNRHRGGLITRIEKTYSVLESEGLIPSAEELPYRIKGVYDEDLKGLVFELPSHL